MVKDYKKWYAWHLYFGWPGFTKEEYNKLPQTRLVIRESLWGNLKQFLGTRL